MVNNYFNMSVWNIAFKGEMKLEKKTQQRVTQEEWRLLQAMRRGMLSPAGLIKVLKQVGEGYNGVEYQGVVITTMLWERR